LLKYWVARYSSENLKALILKIAKKQFQQLTKKMQLIHIHAAPAEAAYLLGGIGLLLVY
jgi:hypothetical protein